MRNACKSSPLIQVEENVHRSSKSSKRSSKHRDSNQYQFHKVANPYHLQNESMLPTSVFNQIGNMQYLTVHHVQKIQWKQVLNNEPRRSSIFSKHLQAMQKAAKQQAQKSKPILKKMKINQVCFEGMEDEGSLSNEQIQQMSERCLSIGLRCKQMGDQQQMEQQQQQMIFFDEEYYESDFRAYSCNQIGSMFYDI